MSACWMPRRCGCAARPLAGPVGRFVSGKARANTVKALVITDADGRLLFCGQTAPGSIHDLTQVRQAGLVELLALIPGVTLLADAGHQGLSAQTAGAVLTPRPARGKNQLPVPPVLAAAHEAERRVHSSRQICVEHDISHLMKWRACPVTSADATTSTPCCAPWPYWSPAGSEPHDVTSPAAHRSFAGTHGRVINPLHRSTTAHG
jgi:hypothetical protein